MRPSASMMLPAQTATTNGANPPLGSIYRSPHQQSPHMRSIGLQRADSGMSTVSTGSAGSLGSSGSLAGLGSSYNSSPDNGRRSGGGLAASGMSASSDRQGLGFSSSTSLVSGTGGGLLSQTSLVTTSPELAGRNSRSGLLGSSGSSGVLFEPSANTLYDNSPVLSRHESISRTSALGSGGAYSNSVYGGGVGGDPSLLYLRGGGSSTSFDSRGGTGGGGLGGSGSSLLSRGSSGGLGGLGDSPDTLRPSSSTSLLGGGRGGGGVGGSGSDWGGEQNDAAFPPRASLSRQATDSSPQPGLRHSSGSRVDLSSSIDIGSIPHYQ